MKKTDLDIYQLLHKFFEMQLPLYAKRSASTIINYKKSLNNFRQYLESTKGIPFTKISFDCFKKDMVYEYLVFLRDTKGNATQTLNLRLAALRSFIGFCSEDNIELGTLYVALKKIHNFKDTSKNKVEYLTESQLKTIFSTPEVDTVKGRRDRFFMIFAYETGGRVQELLDMKLENISKNSDFYTVKLYGKGSKTRTIPLMPETVGHLERYIAEFHPDNNKNEYLFYTVHDDAKTQMKVGTVDSFLKRYAKIAHKKESDFPEGLHCHMFRHSIAMAMYKKGIPLSYIKDFLGHSSYESTKIYAYADDATIAEALKSVNHEHGDAKVNKKWKGSEEELLKYCGLL